MEHVVIGMLMVFADRSALHITADV